MEKIHGKEEFTKNRIDGISEGIIKEKPQVNNIIKFDQNALERLFSYAFFFTS